MTGAHPQEWREYLERFHDERAGITERMLGRAVDAVGMNPYEWVREAIESTGLVLDIGCGSSPLAPLLEEWVGLDTSMGELRRCLERDRQPVINADADALPIRSGGAVSVSAVMSLMVVDDPRTAMSEAARSLAPGGTLVALLPTAGPLQTDDRIFYTLLATTLGPRITPFPSPQAVRNPEPILDAAGFRIVHDERRRFAFPLEARSDATLFVDGLYLRGTASWRERWARTVVRTWPASSVGLPLRRIVARSKPKPQAEAG